MPPPNPTLTTLERVKVYMNFTDTTWDTAIEYEIDAVSLAIEKFCGHTFGINTLSDLKIDGDGTVELQLRFPIVSITSISNDGTAVVETTNYEKYPETGLVVLTDGSAWVSGHKKITITYSYGYEASELPRDIISAATMWVCKRMDDIIEKRVGVASVSRGDESISYEKGMPGSVKELLAPYVLSMGGW